MGNERVETGVLGNDVEMGIGVGGCEMTDIERDVEVEGVSCRCRKSLCTRTKSQPMKRCANVESDLGLVSPASPDSTVRWLS